MSWSPDRPIPVPRTVASAEAEGMTPDPRALEVPLERQLSVLVPIAGRLHVADAHPLVAPHDWQGPAAGAYRDLEDALRHRVRQASEAAEAAVHATRRALAVAARLADLQLPDV